MQSLRTIYLEGKINRTSDFTDMKDKERGECLKELPSFQLVQLFIYGYRSFRWKPVEEDTINSLLNIKTYK